MLKKRFVLILVPSVLLGLAGLLVGCSSEISSGPVPDKDASKQIKEQMKRDQMERKAARAQQQR